MKLVHDIQPVGWKRFQISKAKETILSRCPCCKTQVETPVHFLTCPTQRPSRYRHLRDLQRAMGSTTAHPALALLYRCIAQWLNNPTEPPTLSVHTAPSHLQPTHSAVTPSTNPYASTQRARTNWMASSHERFPHYVLGQRSLHPSNSTTSSST
jgi:hypothetical protein